MNRIRERRLYMEMTQKQLAEAAGLSQPFLHDLELGRRTAKKDTWERIANVLGCTVSDIKCKPAWRDTT